MEAEKMEAAPQGPPLSYSQPSDAQRLRQLLSQLSLSQRGAAAELGANPRDMRYWCSGERPVPRMVVLALERLVDLQRMVQNGPTGG